MSATAYRCPACQRRVRSAPYLSLRDRASRRETRYHNGAACLETGALAAQDRGPGEIVLNFIHAVACGDPANKLHCAGRCFDSLADQQEGQG